VPPPSTEGTPIAAVKMQRTKKSGGPGSIKKRNTSKGNKTISSEKSKAGNEKSQAEEVVDLEKMEKTPLKAKGKKGQHKEGKGNKR
jgi:hypothetical protein